MKNALKNICTKTHLAVLTYYLLLTSEMSLYAIHTLGGFTSVKWGHKERKCLPQKPLN